MPWFECFNVRLRNVLLNLFLNRIELTFSSKRGSRLISEVRLKRWLEKSIIVCFSSLCSISCGKGKQSDRWCWCW